MNGNLDQVRLVDVLRTLGEQGANGCLRLEKSKDGPPAELWLEAGALVRVVFKKREKSKRVGELLVQAGVIEAFELSNALSEQKNAHVLLGQILVSSNICDSQTMQGFLDFQARDCVWGLLQRTKGEFVFEELALQPGAGQITPWPCNSMLLAEMGNPRRWDMIVSAIGGADTVLERGRRDQPGAGDGQDALALRLFGLVDGERTVSELLVAGRAGTYVGSVALWDLVREGYVTLSQATTAEVEQLTSRRAPWLSWLLYLLVNVAAGALLLTALRELPNESSEAVGRLGGIPTAVEQRLRLNVIEIVRSALELYRIEEGRYPDELRSLSEMGLISEGVIKAVAEAHLDYLSVGTDYDLRVGK